MDSHNDVKNLIKRGVITGGADNNSSFPVQQVSFFNSVSDCQMLFPYGMYANATSPEKADSLVTIFNVGNIEEDRIGIPYTPLKRPTDLDQGEVAFYHPDTETFIKYRNNGDLEIDSGNGGTGNIIVNCAVATINCTTSVTFDTPTATFTGDLQVDGDFNNDGKATLGGTGGEAIARLGDAVVTTGGSGTITGGSINHTAT